MAEARLKSITYSKSSVPQLDRLPGFQGSKVDLEAGFSGASVDVLPLNPEVQARKGKATGARGRCVGLHPSGTPSEPALIGTRPRNTNSLQTRHCQL